MPFPLHPVFVHFPIALFFFEAFLLILHKAKNDVLYRTFALLTFKTAYVFLLISIAFGIKDAGGWSNIFKYETVKLHFFSAAFVFTVATVRALLWKMIPENHSKGGWVHLAGAVLGLAGILAAGYYGGLLVYGQSV